MSSGKVEWTSAFNLEVTSNEILVSVRISLLVPKDVNRSKLEKNIISWEEAIYSAWNNRFYISINNAKLPIKLHVRFTHYQPHHRVVVHPGNWTPNQHNWYLNTPDLVIAHEIGHMLGAYDEYPGGALSPDDPVIDITSIMGGKPVTGIAYPRHLALLKKLLADQFEDIEIIIQIY